MSSWTLLFPIFCLFFSFLACNIWSANNNNFSLISIYVPPYIPRLPGLKMPYGIYSTEEQRFQWVDILSLTLTGIFLNLQNQKCSLQTICTHISLHSGLVRFYHMGTFHGVKCLFCNSGHNYLKIWFYSLNLLK